MHFTTCPKLRGILDLQRTKLHLEITVWLQQYYTSRAHCINLHIQYFLLQCLWLLWIMNNMDDDSEITRAMLMSLNLQDSPISKDVMRSLLECEEVSWIVRREEQSKFDSMTIRDHDGLLMLFSDDARGIFECVLQKSPQSREVYRYFMYLILRFLNSDWLKLKAWNYRFSQK